MAASHPAILPRRQLSHHSPSKDANGGIITPRSYERTQTHIDLAAGTLGMPLAWSRRLSRSLPELRDVHLVSELSALAEEDPSSEETHDLSSLPSGRNEGPYGNFLPWFKRYDFVWTCFTQALDFETVWRFPFYCYVCGGGAFVFGCLGVLVTCAAPLLCAELSLGQLAQTGVARTMAQVCPLLKGLGLSILVILFFLSASYSVLTSYFVCYFFHSFYSTPTFLQCANAWNSLLCQDSLRDLPTPMPKDNMSATINQTFLGHATAPEEFLYYKLLDVSSGITQLGELRVYLLLCAAFLWFFVFCALRKYSHFTSNFILFIVGISYIMFGMLFIRALLLPGAPQGLQYFLTPRWDQLADPHVWLYGLAQVLHSLGTCIGTSLTLGSRSKQHNNTMRDTGILVLFNVFALLLVGCVCFSTLGHLALISEQSIEVAAKKDPVIAFLLYSVLMGTLPLPSLWSVIFYFLLLCIGIKYQFRIMGTLVLSLEEAYTSTIKAKFMGHSLFLLTLCAISFGISMFFMTQAGIYLLQAVDWYVSILGVSVVASVLSATIGWIYGAGRLAKDIRRMIGQRPSFYYIWTWRISAPLVAGGLLVWAAVVGLRPAVSGPHWPVGASCLTLTLCWIPILMVKSYLDSSKSHPIERLLATVEPRFEPKGGKPKVPILYIRTVVPFTGEDPDCSNSEYPELTISEI